MNPQPTIDVMSATAQTLTCGDIRDKLRSIRAAQDALDAAAAVLLAELESSKDFEIDGASTLKAWARNELRMSSGQAAALVRGTQALRDLPLVAEAAESGNLSAEHLTAFAYGLRHVGLEPMLQHEQVLLAVALEHDPNALFETIKHLKARVHPDELDDSWRRGMDTEDFTVNAVPTDSTSADSSTH